MLISKTPDLKDRIASLSAIRDQSRVDAVRASAMLESAGQKAITAPMLAKFAQTARQRIRLDGGGLPPRPSPRARPAR